MTIALCDACYSLASGMAGIPPHDNLRYQGFTPQGNSPPGDQGPVERINHYRCIQCETRWLHKIGKWGVEDGFRLAV